MWAWRRGRGIMKCARVHCILGWQLSKGPTKAWLPPGPERAPAWFCRGGRSLARSKNCPRERWRQRGSVRAWPGNGQGQSWWLELRPPWSDSAQPVGLNQTTGALLLCIPTCFPGCVWSPALSSTGHKAPSPRHGQTQD